MRFNRAEHLRIIPPGTEAGERLIGFRQDSESGFSTLDETHRLRRIPAYGADGALLIYIGYAWAKISVALGITRRTGSHEAGRRTSPHDTLRRPIQGGRRTGARPHSSRA